MSAATWVGVAAVGGLGALIRFLLDRLVASRTGRGFPFGTLAVNASGALLLGFCAGISLSGATLAIAGTALLGSYTTFSTWMLETHRLVEDAGLARAAGNAIISLLLGFGAAALGHLIGTLA